MQTAQSLLNPYIKVETGLTCLQRESKYIIRRLFCYETFTEDNWLQRKFNGYC